MLPMDGLHIDKLLKYENNISKLKDVSSKNFFKTILIY